MRLRISSQLCGHSSLLAKIASTNLIKGLLPSSLRSLSFRGRCLFVWSPGGDYVRAFPFPTTYFLHMSPLPHPVLHLSSEPARRSSTWEFTLPPPSPLPLSPSPPSPCPRSAESPRRPFLLLLALLHRILIARERQTFGLEASKFFYAL